MHQTEADSYGPNTYLHDMWVAVRELGHNSKFYMNTVKLFFNKTISLNNF